MIIEAIRDFIKLCPHLNEFTPINVDYLDKDAVNYSIQATPCVPVIKKFIDGSTTRQFTFLFASREVYGPDEILNIENSGFYEKFANWIEEQSKNLKLPILSDGKQSIELQVLTPGYVFQTDIDRGQYQIQLKLIYFSPN
ncbi:MAG: chloramphenicol resistance protein [Sarcina sp.]